MSPEHIAATLLIFGVIALQQWRLIARRHRK